jgi:hypothetical protein
MWPRHVCGLISIDYFMSVAYTISHLQFDAYCGKMTFIFCLKIKTTHLISFFVFTSHTFICRYKISHNNVSLYVSHSNMVMLNQLAATKECINFYVLCNFDLFVRNNILLLLLLLLLYIYIYIYIIRRQRHH